MNRKLTQYSSFLKALLNNSVFLTTRHNNSLYFFLYSATFFFAFLFWKLLFSYFFVCCHMIDWKCMLRNSVDKLSRQARGICLQSPDTQVINPLFVPHLLISSDWNHGRNLHFIFDHITTPDEHLFPESLHTFWDIF